MKHNDWNMKPGEFQPDCSWCADAPGWEISDHQKKNG